MNTATITKWLTASVAGLGFSLNAVASDYHDSGRYSDTDTYYEYAQVTDVHPIMESVNVNQPRRECRVERVAHRTPVSSRGNGYNGHRSYTPEIVGAVLGGAVGRKVGRGRGQDVATVVGAVLGGSIGRDINKRNYRGHKHADRYETRYENVETCRTVDNYHTEERVVGYKVRYQYDGKQYWTQTDHDPGNRIKVRVSVQPATAQSGSRYGYNES